MKYGMKFGNGARFHHVNSHFLQSIPTLCVPLGVIRIPKIDSLVEALARKSLVKQTVCYLDPLKIYV